jgi:hypothetical protein
MPLKKADDEINSNGFFELFRMKIITQIGHIFHRTVKKISTLPGEKEENKK